jgi:hypothetical protein
VFALGVFVVSVIAIWQQWPRQIPTGFQFVNDTFSALDTTGRILWQYRFPFAIAHVAYAGDPSFVANYVQFADLNQDQRNDVVLVVKPQSAPDAIYAFDSDGRLLFKRQPGRPVTFGGEDYSPPFFGMTIRLSSGLAGETHIWVVAQHHAWSPSVVEKLSADGRLLAEYWNNGHITRLTESSLWDGRKVILVGAMDKEEGRTSLTVLDYDNPAGSNPTSNPKYRCANCPDGQSLAFFVFPRSEIARVIETRPRITTLRVLADGDVELAVENAGPPLPGSDSPSLASVFYVFDPQLHLKRVVPGDTYRHLHAELELRGAIDHRYGAQDEIALAGIMRWDRNVLQNVTQAPKSPSTSVSKP